MRTTRSGCFLDSFPYHIEHKVHEYVRLGDICRLREVSSTLNHRVSAALQEDFSWDLTYSADFDGPLYRWLELIVRINVRSRVVSIDANTVSVS